MDWDGPNLLSKRLKMNAAPVKRRDTKHRIFLRIYKQRWGSLGAFKSFKNIPELGFCVAPPPPKRFSNFVVAIIYIHLANI